MRLKNRIIVLSVLLGAFFLTGGCSNVSADEYYMMGQTEYGYTIRGILSYTENQNERDLAEVSVPKDTKIHITGTMEDSVKITYHPADEEMAIKIENENGKIDQEIIVQKGKGRFCISGNEGEGRYSFELRISADQKIDLFPMKKKSFMDKMNNFGIRFLGRLLDRQSFDPALVADWPYEVSRKNKNFTNEALVLYVKTGVPLTAIVESVTQEGTIGIRIEDEKGNISFKEEDMLTGYYIVDLDREGSYVITISAKQHTGKFNICAVEREE